MGDPTKQQDMTIEAYGTVTPPEDKEVEDEE